MEATAFLSGHGCFDDKISHIDQVTQFADFRDKNGAVVKVFGFVVENFKSDQCSLQANIRAHYAHIAAHDALEFANSLGNEDHFFVQDHSFGVPVGDIIAKGDFFDEGDRIDSSTVGEDG